MPFLPNGVIGGAAALCLLTAAPVHAAEQPAEPVSVWSLSFYKALTYELVANSADVVLYATALSSAAASEGLFAAVNGFTSVAAYVTHEAAWQHYGPAMDRSADTAVTVGLAKTISYRAVSTARYLTLGYAFTGDPWSSAGFALATAATHTLLYAGNEYLWHAYGPTVRRPAAEPDPAILEAELELQ